MSKSDKPAEPFVKNSDPGNNPVTPDKSKEVSGATNKQDEKFTVGDSSSRVVRDNAGNPVNNPAGEKSDEKLKEEDDARHEIVEPVDKDSAMGSSKYRVNSPTIPERKLPEPPLAFDAECKSEVMAEVRRILHDHTSADSQQEIQAGAMLENLLFGVEKKNQNLDVAENIEKGKNVLSSESN